MEQTILKLLTAVLLLMQSQVAQIALEPRIVQIDIKTPHSSISSEISYIPDDSISIPEELLRAGGCETAGSPDNLPRHFDNQGNVIKHINNNGTVDYGKFQINSIHIPEAERLGLDIKKEKDNEKMAKILYDRHGVDIWFGYDKDRKTCSYLV